MVKQKKETDADGFNVYKENVLAQVIKFIGLHQSNELSVGKKLIQLVYLVSITWWKKWKKYVCYDEYRLNGKRTDAFGSPLFKPDTISNAPLVENDSFISKTSDEIDPFNIKLKANLKEGADYIALHENEWRFLKDIYGSDYEISRFKTFKDGKEAIEDVLPIIPYIVLPTKDSNLASMPFKVKYTQISKYKTASDFKTRVIKLESKPIYGISLTFESMKIWVASQKGFSNLAELSNDLKKFSKKYLVLDDNLKMEGIQLPTNGYILVESTELDPAKCNICVVCQSKFLKGSDCANVLCKKIEKQKASIEPIIFKPKGIKNKGNTCFMASSLQALFSARLLFSYFKEGLYIKHINKHSPSNGKMAIAFAYTVTKYWQSKKSAFSPKILKNTIAQINNIYGSGHQQDAAEFIIAILDLLHEDLNTIKIKQNIEYATHSSPSMDAEQYKKFMSSFCSQNSSIISSNFFGSFKCTIACSKCGNSSNKFETYNTVMLSIPTMTNQVVFIANSKGLNQIQIEFFETLTPNVIENYCKRNTELNSSSYFVFQVSSEGVVQKRNDEKIDCKKTILLIPLSEIDKLLFLLVSYSKSNNAKVNNYDDILILSSGFEIKSICDAIDSYNKRIDFKKFGKEGNKLDISLKYCSEELYNYSMSEKLERTNCNEKKSTPITFNKDNLYSHFMIANVKINTDVYSPTVPHTSGSFIENKYQKIVSSAKMLDCINAFSLPEILGKDNLWFCNKCDESVVAHKSICIYSLPKIFIVSFKRFQNNLIKLGTQVDVPLTMKLFDYANSKEKAYELIAVIHHFGSISGGHYTCHARIGDEWYYFNDSTATYINTKEIEALVSNPSAYILFYKEYDI